MNRVVFEIRRNGETDELLLNLAEPGGYPGAGDFYRFSYDSDDPEPSGFTAGTAGADEVGEYIIRKLTEHHPTVPTVLGAALATPCGSQTQLFVRVSPQAESIPWETLYKNPDFLALDQRWPIGRLSAGEIPASAGPAEFRPPLRVMAVLAAARIDASQEWAELRDALGTLPFEVSVRVLTSQDALHTAVQGGNPGNLTVTAEYVPPGLGLPEKITGFRPNILHFFCHGGVDASSSLLEIATRSTANRDRGGVILELKDFPTGPPVSDLWLVVLNACRGALPPAGAASLVSELAARGVPAVAGMREAVAQNDAHAFCRGFYQELAKLLAPLASQPGLLPVAWCSALHRARQEICELHRGTVSCVVAAPRIREWTLPVMYVQSAPFVLSRPPVPASPLSPLTADQRIAAETELGLLRALTTLQAGTPPEVIDAYRARIGALERILAT